MTQQEPEARPSVEEVLRRWHEIRSEISGIDAFWRLRVSRGLPYLEAYVIFPYLDTTV